MKDDKLNHKAYLMRTGQLKGLEEIDREGAASESRKFLEQAQSEEQEKETRMSSPNIISR